MSLGISFRPSHAINLYKGTKVTVQVYLWGPPLKQLGGSTKLTFRTSDRFPDSMNCTDCVQIEPKSLVFTSNNWEAGQTITLTYLNDGHSLFTVDSTGGGYDWIQYRPEFDVLSCTGNDETGCYQNWRMT